MTGLQLLVVHVCVPVCTCVRVLLHKRRLEGNLGILSGTLCTSFETGSLLGLELISKASLASEPPCLPCPY